MSARLHEAQTISDFLKKYPVVIELTEVPENPLMEDSAEKMINYFVVLKHDGKVMSLYYSTGLGWIETITGKPVYGNVVYRKRDKTFLERRGNTLYDANAVSRKHRIRKPTASDIVDTLASDASGVDQAFEDWASDLGYDTDSRKAEEIYKTCQKQARELRQLLGTTAFDELVNQTERL